MSNRKMRRAAKAKTVKTTQESAPAPAQDLVQTTEIDRKLKTAIGLQQNDQPDKAYAIYRDLLKENPGFVPALINCGILLRKQKKYAESKLYYDRALTVKPNDPITLVNLANLLRDMARLDEALAISTYLINLNPNDAGFWRVHGLTYQKMERYEESIEALDKSVALDPQNTTIFDLSQSLLYIEEYERGWEAYEKRWGQEGLVLRDFGTPTWNGTPIPDKTLYVFAEQGYGDAIQFARFIPLIKDKVGKIILECRGPVMDLFATIDGVDEIVERYSGAVPQHDYNIAMLSLPYVLKINKHNLPADCPYLSVPHTAREKVPDLSHIKKFKIGFAFSGRPSQGNNHNRECALDYFLELQRFPQVQLFCFQKGHSDTEIEDRGLDHAIINLAPRFETFGESGALLEQMDLLISTDTGIVHLAAALGLPVWDLLSYYNNWRYLRDRTDNPWYPTLRLFRQKFLGDWDGIFKQVVTALEEELKTWEPSLK